MYDHLCQFQSENVFQIPIRLPDETIFDIEATILLKDPRFVEKRATESTSRQIPIWQIPIWSFTFLLLTYSSVESEQLRIVT